MKRNAAKEPLEAEEKTSKTGKFLWFSAIFIIGIAGLLYFSSLEFLRQPVSKALSKATGLDIRFKSISFSKGLGIQLRKVAIHTKDGAKELFSSNKLILNIEWKPLLEKKIQIINASIVEPVFKIDLNAFKGKTAQTAIKGKILKASFSPIKKPSIAHFVNATGKASFSNEASWRKLQSNLRNVYLNIDSLEIDRGSLVLILNKEERKQEASISISTILSVRRSSVEKLDIKTSRLQISSGSLQIKGGLEALDLLSPQALLRFKAYVDDLSVSQLHEIALLFPPSIQKTLSEKPEGSIKKISMEFSMSPTVERNRPFLNGLLEMEKAVWPGENKPLTIESAQTTLTASSPNFLDAKTIAGQIKVGKLSFNSFNSELEWRNRKLHIKKGALFPPHGNLEFNGFYQPTASNYNFDFTSDKLRVEDFSENKAQGPLEISGNVKGVLPQTAGGSNEGNIFKGMDGKARIEMKEGKVPSLELLGTLMSFSNPKSENELLQRGMVYQRLWGDFKMQKGVVSTSNLSLIGNRLNIRAQGKADLNSQTINAQVRGLPLKLLEQLTGPLPDLGPLLDSGGLQEAVYLKVSGPLKTPQTKLIVDPRTIQDPAKVLSGLLGLAFPGR